jgi:hypothetical protein
MSDESWFGRDRDVVSFIHSFISCSFMMSDLSNRVVEFSGAKNKQDMRKPVESWFWSGSSLRKRAKCRFSFVLIRGDLID